MNKRLIGRIGIALAISILLVSGSCTGVGIFAVVAVSEKIDEGLLPEGLSARPVVHISPGDATDDYYFFASGPGIWAKDTSTSNNLWLPISLNSDGIEWDGVQSMAVTDDRIFLALYDVNGDDYKVSIHTLDFFNGSTTLTTFTHLDDQVWTSGPSGFQTIKLFCPDPVSGTVYVNVMEHTGLYGSLDSDDNGFTGSMLYLLPDTATQWSNGTAAGTQSELDGTNKARYMTGVASDGATVFLTATTNMFDSSGGILLDGDGGLVGDGSIDGSFVATTGITWIERNFIDPVNSDLGPDAFIVSATFLDGGTLPMFATVDDGTTWYRLGGTTTDFLTTNFIDVSDKPAGQSDSKHLVLAGTSSYIDGSTSHIASGYNEINVTSDDPSTWSVSTNWDDYSLALNTNYSVSDLAQATIIGMSIPEDGDDLYASTRNFGVWKIDLTTDKPSWTRE